MDASTAMDALVGAWPEVGADPALRADYERALAGLDPAAATAVVAAVRSAGRERPRPGTLRVAILARRAAPAPAVTAPALPRDAPAAPPRGAAITLVVATFLGMYASQQPWARVTGDGLSATFPGTSMGGGLLTSLQLLALAASVIALVYGIRGRASVRHHLQAFGFLLIAESLSLLLVGAAYVWLGGLREAAGRTPGYHAEAATGLHYAAGLTTIGLAAAIFGFGSVAQRSGLPSAAGLRRSAREWAIVAGALAVGCVVVWVLVARSGPHGQAAAEARFQRTIASTQAAHEQGVRSSAANAFAAMRPGITSDSQHAYMAIASAARAHDPRRTARAVRAFAQVRADARMRVLALQVPEAAVPAQIAAGSADLRQRRLYLRAAALLERGSAISEADAQALIAADAAAVRAEDALEAALR